MIRFLHADVARWLPWLLAIALLVVVLARWRAGGGLRAFTRRRDAAHQAWWQRKLGRLGRNPWFIRAINVIQVASLLAAIAMILLLLAGPILGHRLAQVRAGTLRVVLMIDESRSADAEDYSGVIGKTPREGSRINMVRILSKRVIRDAAGNRFAMCVYGSEGLMLQPTWVTNPAPLWFAGDKFLKAGGVPGGSKSDIANGLDTVMTFFGAPEPDVQDLIVLFSDGGFSAEESNKVDKMERLKAQIARVNGRHVRLVIVALGSNSPVPIPEYQLNQDGRLVKVGELKLNGMPLLTATDHDFLEKLRDAVAGAQMFKIRRPDDLKIDWPSAVGASNMQKTEAPAARLIALLAMLCLFIRLSLP